jgi:demethoxyubiquinone hydroxylase (CLK1/Coq7/Cat5 family)
MLAKNHSKKVALNSVRAFSSQNPNDFRDKMLSVFDGLLKTVEAMNEEYFTSDKPPSKAQVQQEVLRSAYLGRYAINQTTDKMNLFTNTFSESHEKFNLLRGIEAKSVEKFEHILPENKVRPSALTPLTHGLALAGAISSKVLGEQTTYKVLKAIEDGIQEEHDNLLRKMNKYDVEDKPTRQLLVTTRDAGYDYFNDNFPELKNNPEEETKKKEESAETSRKFPDSNDVEKYLTTAAKYITIGLMKAGRKV